MSLHSYQQKAVALGLKGYPTSAHFEITHACNCSCSYCYLRDHPPVHMPLQKVLEAITILKNNGIMYLVLTGGEIFTHPDILSIFTHVLEGDFFETNLITNAVLINDEHLRFLGDHTSHFKSVQISIFSDIPEENDRYMGNGALTKVLAVAEQLQKAGLQVELVLSVQSFNVHRIGAIMDYYENLGFEISFSPYKVISSGNAHELNELTTCEFYKAMFLSLGKQRISSFKRGLTQKCMLPKRKGLCSGILCSFMLDPAGTVFPCTSFRNYPLGNIFAERNLEKIFTSEPMKLLRNLSIEDYRECAACRFANYCSLCVGRWHTSFGRFGVIDEQLCNIVLALNSIADA